MPRVKNAEEIRSRVSSIAASLIALSSSGIIVLKSGIVKHAERFGLILTNCWQFRFFYFLMESMKLHYNSFTAFVKD